MHPAIRMVLAGVALGCAWSAQAACFQIYNSKGELIYRSTEPPVDMSRPLHEALQQLVPGARMVFTPDLEACELHINRLPNAPKVAVEEEGNAVILSMPGGS